LKKAFVLALQGEFKNKCKMLIHVRAYPAIARSSAERDLSSLAVRDGNNRVKSRRTAMNYDEYVRVCMVLPSGFQVL